MNSVGRLAIGVADSRHHAGPSAFGLEIAEIVVEQQVRTAWVLQPAALQVALGNGSCQGRTASENAGDLVAVICPHGIAVPNWRWQIQPRFARRLLEQRGRRQPGGEMEKINRSSAFACGVIVAPSCTRSPKMDDARAPVARWPSR